MRMLPRCGWERERETYEGAAVGELDVVGAWATRAGREKVLVGGRILAQEKVLRGNREGDGHEGREREGGASDHGWS